MRERLSGMTDLSRLGTEEWETVRSEARLFHTVKLREVLTALEPIVLGYAGGPPTPAMVRAYVSTLRELGLVYGVYDPPVQREDEGAGALQLAETQQLVLGQLETLAAKLAQEAQAG